jgi:hypothetical protein
MIGPQKILLERVSEITDGEATRVRFTLLGSNAKPGFGPSVCILVSKNKSDHE